MRMKILIVEDEKKLNEAIAIGLKNRGYIIDTALDGEEGESLARINNYDCIVLDIMMPKRDGLQMCYNLRTNNILTPIIFLTARDAVADKIEGLDIGADDYIVKPFAIDELAARIRTIMRRPQLVSFDILKLDTLELDTRSQKVSIANKDITLTVREYGLLEYFLRHTGAVITRQDILDHVWDRFDDSLSNVVDVHIKNLRKKLPSLYAKRIKTVWGKGYRMA